MIFQLGDIKVVFSTPQYGEREKLKIWKAFEWENFLHKS